MGMPQFQKKELDQMNCANAIGQVEVAQIEIGENEVQGLSVEQLDMIAGGECVTNNL